MVENFLLDNIKNLSTFIQKILFIMFCSDKDLKKLFETGTISIDRQSIADIKTSSIDLMVSNIISIPKGSAIINSNSSFEDIKSAYNEIDIGDGWYTLEPNQSVIASTNRIALNGNYIGIMVNRNSLIRLGINISVSIINPGYSGILPFVIHNNSGFKFQFKQGDKLCQLLIAETGSVENPYYTRDDAKYKNSTTILSQYHLDK